MREGKTKAPAPPVVANNLNDFEQGLAIDEHALNEALQMQPDLFYQVAKHLALQISRRDAAKQEVEEVEARAEIKIRHEAEVHNEKITVAEVTSRRVLDRDVINATKILLQLSQSVGQLTALKEAFIQRSHALSKLVDLYIHNYYGDPASGGNKHEYRERAGQDGREAMQRVRSGKSGK